MKLPIEIVSRRRRANFDAYEIGQPVPGPLETLDSDEPWMDDHFTQENFEQLQDAQMDGELGPPLDMSKRAGTLPTSFTYWIDMDERGEFRATVHDPRGREVMSINEEIFEDGYMRHKKDLSGLASYLEDLGIGGRGTQVQIARNASFARRAGRSRFARFAEGDTAGFEKWLKTQPKDVQEDWEANKEKYGDKFKTAAKSVPLEGAKKGDMVNVTYRGEKVTGKVVQVKKDGTVTVNIEKTKDNPGGHSDEDVAWVDFRVNKAKG